MRVSVQNLAVAILIGICCTCLVPAQSALAAQAGDNQQPVASAPASPQDNAPPGGSNLADRNDPNALQMPAKLPPPKGIDDVISRIVYREKERMAMMRKMTPLVETYIQNLQPDRELGTVPKEDTYLLGKLHMEGGLNDVSFLPEPGIAGRAARMFTRFFSVDYISNGFAQMILIDGDGFDAGHYDFKYLRREFLGEVRTLVFDVTPRKNTGLGRFLGRIWVEDVDYNVVRFNGIYEPPPSFHHYFHFDSWRTNMGPGLWLPTYVYSEESDFPYFIHRKLRFKSQTRLWGYDLKHAGRQEEFTALLVDSPDVKDQTDTARDTSPVGALRGWERQAEDNVIERLERAGLVAPDGEVNKVLETVINNLEVTNNLDVQPEVRVRVLLTAPLESFTVGHTIVMSRGLIDVLPDEASLAMILAHELAHIALGHRLDTRYAFNDRMLFADEKTFNRFGFRWSDRDERDADQKAMEFLKKSPYADKLASAGLFLKAMDSYGRNLQALVRPHLGNQLMRGNKEVRLAQLMGGAPTLERKKMDQIAALPLGGRVKMDAWSSRITLVRSKPVTLLSAREKLPFEITPFMPYLTRESSTEQAMAATRDPKPAAANQPAAGDNPAARPGSIADAPLPEGRHNPPDQPPPDPPAQKPPADPQPPADLQPNPTVPANHSGSQQ